MSIAKFNKNTASRFTFKSEGERVYLKIADLYKQNGPDKTYPVLALYINDKSKFGKHPMVAVGSCTFVNLPKHLVNDVEQMINDPEVVNQINRNEAGFKIRSYTNQNNTISYSVEWVDLPPAQLPF